MTHHPVGHILRVCILRGNIALEAAMTQHSHTVGKTLHLMHLVGDDDDGFSVVSHIPEHFKKLLCLLRGQYGRGLVQNQDICSAVKHFDDLHRLFLGDGHVVNLLVRVHLETIFVADLSDLRGSLLQI